MVDVEYDEEGTRANGVVPIMEVEKCINVEDMEGEDCEIAMDDLTGKELLTRTETPPAAPLGFTNMLIGLQQAEGPHAIQMIMLNDAPEGGVCKPSAA